MIKIVKDTPLIEDVFEYDVILFAMGINNSMANGFSYDIALHFPTVLENEGRYQYGDLRKYGTIHETVCSGLTFVACYVKNPAAKKNKSDVFVLYDFLEECIKMVKEKYKGKKIACCIIGSNEYDGNGDKEKIIEIFEKYFKKSGSLTLYDYKQKNFYDEMYKKIKHAYYMLIHKAITFEEYLEIRRVIEWRKKKGIFSEVPKDYVFKLKRKNKRKITHTKEGVSFL